MMISPSQCRLHAARVSGSTALLSLVLLAGITPAPSAVAGNADADGASASGEVRFVEDAERSGLDFTHVNGMVGNYWLAEVIGSGVAVLDFDNDGWLDLWVVQGGPFGDRSGTLPQDQLFRNVTVAGELRFSNVTAASGVHATGYGMGIATADIDNDGDFDVFLANYGANQLYENLGDGRFKDITQASGLAGTDWSIAASFADFDGDGWTDLYVANYVEFDLDSHKVCHDLAARPTYCTPEVYRSTSDRLYRNLGNGRFQDVTRAAAVEGSHGGALGVVAADFNGDGRIDFYVANDAAENLLWLNRGDGSFVNRALLTGVAVNGNGQAEASMGIAAQDFDGDCDVDIFLTHLAAETNTLYVNEGGGWFSDRSNSTRVAASSAPFTGFGTGWFDADNDGDLDLFSANGAVTALPDQLAAGSDYPLQQVNQLWLNDGRGRYRESAGGPAFKLEEVSRGAAFGDLDNDGDIDIVVTNNRGQARLYRNDSPRAHWLGVELSDGFASRLGSRARLEANPCGYRRAATDGSYASASDPRLVFGLAGDAAAQYVRVQWVDGSEEAYGPLAADRYHRLRRGQGRAVR